MKKQNDNTFLKKYKEALFSLVMLILSALVIYFTKDIQRLVINTTVDARFWPKVCGTAGCIFSGILFIQSMLEAKAKENIDPGTQEEKPSPAEKFLESDNFRTLGTLGLTILFVAALKPFGFIFSSLIYLFLLFMLLSEKTERNTLKLILIDVIFTLAVFFLFRYAFQMMLPIGTIWATF